MPVGLWPELAWALALRVLERELVAVRAAGLWPELASALALRVLEWELVAVPVAAGLWPELASALAAVAAEVKEPEAVLAPE